MDGLLRDGGFRQTVMVGEGTEVMSGVLYFVCVGLRVRSGGHIEDQGERWKVIIM